MKLLFDLVPIILFFVAYKLRGIYTATGILMAACCAQVAFTWLRHRKVEAVHLWTLGTVVVLGGATLALRNPAFIKWKPTIVNWGLALVFLASGWIGEKPLVQRMLGAALVMTRTMWSRLNLAWVLFFLACGVANLYVAAHWSENAWVHFKLFGLTGFSIAFMVGQMVVLRAYLQAEEVTA